MMILAQFPVHASWKRLSGLSVLYSFLSTPFRCLMMSDITVPSLFVAKSTVRFSDFVFLFYYCKLGTRESALTPWQETLWRGQSEDQTKKKNQTVGSWLATVWFDSLSVSMLFQPVTPSTGKKDKGTDGP